MSTTSLLTNTENPGYIERVKLGIAFMRALPLGALFIPFVFLSAMLGCWKRINTGQSWKIGDMNMSMDLTVFPAGVVYILLFQAALTYYVG